MTLVDGLLETLRTEAADLRLSDREEVILQRAASRREGRRATRMLACTGLFALGFGLVASLVPDQAAAPVQVAMLNTTPANAPSSLLLGQR